MQSETGFSSSHQLKSYVASKSCLKLAARAVLSADAGLLVMTSGLGNRAVPIITASEPTWDIEACQLCLLFLLSVCLYGF